MYWIVGTIYDADTIFGGAEMMKSRHQYIEDVTKSKVSDWKMLIYNGKIQPYMYCVSDDNVNGVIFTGHINLFNELCNKWNEIKHFDYVVCNACELSKIKALNIRRSLLTKNKNCRFFFAKQCNEASGINKCIKMNSINYVGGFGFYTSKSERMLFKKRNKRFLEAIEEAYVEIKS